MAFKYTSEQDNIKEAVINTKKNIMVESGAGVGIKSNCEA
jgi:hypothetical protein